MKFFRKKISESEFAEVLADCAETAREAYKRVFKYQKECEDIILELNNNLDKVASELLNKKDARYFEFSKALEKVFALQKYSNNGLQDLKDSIKIKRKHLKDFTITLFGRTKAGKSTLRESITKNGDGSTIGLGYLHFTKEAGDYRWKGLRILDTPGVEGYGGEREAEKAREVIDQTDVVVFLTTDESQQPGEFDEMERLIEINKPYFVVLNIKDKLTEPVYLKRFFKYKAKIFSKEVIEEHKKRIISETKRIGIHNVNIIWISALASCIAQFAERGFNSQNKNDFIATIQHPQLQSIIKWFLNNLTTADAQRLWQLSQIDKVYERIAIEVNTHGKQRRVLTFFDSIIYFIDTIIKMLWQCQREIQAQVRFMLDKKRELKNFFDNFIKESNLKIERKCEELFRPIKEWIPGFVDEYFGEKSAQNVLNRELNNEMKKIEKEMNSLIEEIKKDLEAQLYEFYQQYQYDVATIEPEPLEIGEFRKGQKGKVLKWTGVWLGGVAAMAFTMGEIAATNFWNPVGWIAASASVVVGFLGWLIEEDEKKEWLKAKRNAKERLWNWIDKRERKTRGAYKTWFYKNITTEGRKAMLEPFSKYISSIFHIADILREYAHRLMELQNKMNKELFAWLIKLEGLDCLENDILSIARELGFATKIILSNNMHIDARVKKNLEKLCNEHILIFNDDGDIRNRVVKALYPAKLSTEQVNVTRENNKIIAKVKCSDREKRYCIGKNGVNVRLASQLCGIKIEII